MDNINTTANTNTNTNTANNVGKINIFYFSSWAAAYKCKKEEETHYIEDGIIRHFFPENGRPTYNQAEYIDDVIYDTVNYGKIFVILTYSGVIINRAVRRIVEDGLFDKAVGLNEAIEITFFNGDDETKIEVDPILGVKNPPEGFCDIGANDARAILRAGADKVRKQNQK